jgi:hypothetical protein
MHGPLVAPIWWRQDQQVCSMVVHRWLQPGLHLHAAACGAAMAQTRSVRLQVFCGLNRTPVCRPPSITLGLCNPTIAPCDPPPYQLVSHRRPTEAGLRRGMRLREQRRPSIHAAMELQQPCCPALVKLGRHVMEQRVNLEGGV